jgi:hypothetical protein
MLFEWLRNVLESVDSPELSGSYEIVRREARQGGPYGSRFENIHHLIGRLHHTMKAIVFLIEARDRLPLFRRRFRIQRKHSPPAIALPLQVHEMNFARITGKLIEDLVDPVQRHVCQAGLKKLDKNFGLSDEFLTKGTSRMWKLKVHAELILLNKIRNMDFKFAYNDRYIGCSKPACYCCRMYMEAQHDKCVLYGHHGVAHLAWQAPPRLNEAGLHLGAAGDGSCLENMIYQIGHDILEYFSDPEPEPPRQMLRRNSFTEIANPDP